MELYESLAKIVNQNIRLSLHFGKVTATSAGSPPTITVLISGSSTPISDIRYLDSYAPQVNDIVILIVNKGDIFALGDLA